MCRLNEAKYFSEAHAEDVHFFHNNRASELRIQFYDRTCTPRI
jgi:hypothetical protein